MSKKERALRVSPAYHDERRYSDEEIRFQKKKKKTCVAASKWRENCAGSVWLRKLRTGKNTKPNQIRNN